MLGNRCESGKNKKE
jgi:threonine dehydrogenase-like Zn-dependent dehydrogenase